MPWLRLPSSAHTYRLFDFLKSDPSASPSKTPALIRHLLQAKLIREEHRREIMACLKNDVKSTTAPDQWDRCPESPWSPQGEAAARVPAMKSRIASGGSARAKRYPCANSHPIDLR
jgi:hypothetical protein